MDTRTVSPVDWAMPDDWVLWRPHLDRAALRTRAIRDSLWPTNILQGLTGLLFIVVALLDAPTIAWPVLVAGVAIIALVAIWTRVDYLCWGHDLGRRWAPLRVDRGHGDLYWRRSDLAGMPWQTVEAAGQIVEVVHFLHGPIASWIDREHVESVHVAAWKQLNELRDCEDQERYLALMGLAATWAGITDDARHLNWHLGRTGPQAIAFEPKPTPDKPLNRHVAALTQAIADQLAIASESLGAERFPGLGTTKKCA